MRSLVLISGRVRSLRTGIRIISLTLPGNFPGFITPDIHSVVFMASSSASNGAEFPLYAASKGGILAYMKNVALRIAQYGATCNSISAGGVLTELNQHIIENPHLMQQCLDETLLHKWAKAEEIAEYCYFLTNINSSMTGQDLLVDNGEQLKSNFIW